jgi:hypothetical protein
MIYAVFFACAIIAGWAFSFMKGGATERNTMCLLSMVWIATIIANGATGSPAPFIYYFVIDAFAIAWLWRHQRKNWQWMPAGLFATMILTHAIFALGTRSGFIPFQGRPYQDILAILGYLQIFSVGWASHERSLARTGRASRLGAWGRADGWVLRERVHHKPHAAAHR